LTAPKSSCPAIPNTGANNFGVAPAFRLSQGSGRKSANGRSGWKWSLLRESILIIQESIPRPQAAIVFKPSTVFTLAATFIQFVGEKSPGPLKIVRRPLCLAGANKVHTLMS
jgi:hypothetical protein